MADLPSAAAVSSASPTLPVMPTANNIVVETAVNSVPDKIQMLSRQIEVTGTLAQPPANNMVTLNTVIGPLILALPHLAQMQQDKLIQQLISLFQNQKPLTVVMQPGNPPSQAFLLLPPLTTTPGQNAPNAYSAAPPAPSAAPPLPVNVTLSAVVLANTSKPPLDPYQQASNYGGFNPSLPAESSPRLLYNPAIAEPLAQIIETAVKTDTAALLTKSAPLAEVLLQNAPSTGINALLQPGAELNLRIDAVITPTAQNATHIPALQPNQITATVIGNGPNGQLILSTGDATLFVRQPAAAPVGTQLILTVEPARLTDMAPLVLPDPMEFTALPQLMAALSVADPATARQILANHIPQPGAALPGALLFFLSAVRQGDVRTWLGDNAPEILTRAGKMELLSKLVDDLQQSGQPTRDNVVGEWRSYPLPVMDNNQLNVLYLHVHGERQRQSSGQGGKDGKTSPTQMRFLIDIRMSKLGTLQLDGFLRPKKLDVVMRSERPLPPWVDQELRLTYARTMDAIGYSGGIAFQSGRQGWLNIQKPAAGAAVVT